MTSRARRHGRASRRRLSPSGRRRQTARYRSTDYRGRSPVFLALFAGLWCPFCRRAIAQAWATKRALKAEGVETPRGRGNRPPETRSLYFKFRPRRLRLAADPGTHDAPRLRCAQAHSRRPEIHRGARNHAINPDRCAPRATADAAGAGEAHWETRRLRQHATDHADMQRQWPQLKGQFVIDRDGIVRWVSIECAEGRAGSARFRPSR